MERVGDKQKLTIILASRDASTLAQVLLELPEDFPPTYACLERSKLRDGPAAQGAQFIFRSERWTVDDRGYVDGAFGLAPQL
jgi:hypothetical protein